MITPFWDTYLSNKDFDSITDFENFNLKIQRVGDSVEISFKHTYSVNVWIYQNDGYYFISANHKTLTENLCSANELIREKRFFEKLILSKHNYQFIYAQNPVLYKYHILGPNFVKTLLNWIDKYTEEIKKIDPEKLRIELSAGVDSRILTYFWRYNSNLYTVYTKPNYQDNELVKYISGYIKNNFPCDINLVETKHSEKSFDYELTGYSSIHGYFANTTIDDFEEIINNSEESNIVKHIVKDICPFYDRLYLSLKGDYQGQVKLLLFDILCNDKSLNEIPVISNVRESFIFDDNIKKILEINRIKKRFIERASKNSELKNKLNEIVYE